MKLKNLKRNNLILFACQMTFILFYPIFQDQRSILRDLIFMSLIFSGIFSLDFSRKTLSILLPLGIVSTFFIWIEYIFAGPIIQILGFLMTFLFLVLIVVFLIRHIAKNKNVDAIIIMSSINGYLLLGVVGSTLLAIADIVQKKIIGLNTPAILFGEGQAQGFHDYLYFSFVTLTTLGYGDIIPSSALAKSITIIISISGQLYITILIAMLVGKFLSNVRH